MCDTTWCRVTAVALAMGAGNELVSFPQAFDSVVGMMTRDDLKTSVATGREVPWAKYLLGKEERDDAAAKVRTRVRAHKRWWRGLCADDPLW